MSFSIAFDVTRQPTMPLRLREYDPVLDDVRSILADLCEQVQSLACGEFLVSGFGQERWPVDVHTDLLVILEQLPDAIRALESGQTAVLDFFEQGIERRVEIRPLAGELEATCSTWTDWQPFPGTVHLSRTDTLNMLHAVLDNFLNLLHSMAPSALTHPWICSWIGRSRMA